MANQITFDRQTYINRRLKFIEEVKTGMYFFMGNDDIGANYKDNVYPFRQDSTFLYYFGINQPNLYGLIDADTGKTYIFGDDIGIDHIIWMGKLPLLSELADNVGIDMVLPLSKTRDYVSRNAHYLPPYRGDHYLFFNTNLGMNVDETDQHVSTKMIKAVVKQRSIKETQEIEELHKAVNATAEMHGHILKSARPGLKEYELVGMAAQKAWELGCTWSFNPIMTKNGQTLHNHDYHNMLKDGQMLLFDGGCQMPSLYAGDMTRTMPVGKRFDTRQEEVYQIVLAALDHSVSLLKPGVRYLDVHLAAGRVLFEGLKSLGITKGNTEEAVNAGAHSVFFQCGLGHMMGLDVHDMENLGEPIVGYHENLIKSTAFGLRSLRLGKELEEGFVITVEPGLYFIPELIDLRRSEGQYKEFINYDELEKYKNFGGIRIEDDYVISKDGYTLLGQPLAKSIEDIYGLRDQAF